MCQCHAISRGCRLLCDINQSNMLHTFRSAATINFLCRLRIPALIHNLWTYIIFRAICYNSDHEDFLDTLLLELLWNLTFAIWNVFYRVKNRHENFSKPFHRFCRDSFSPAEESSTKILSINPERSMYTIEHLSKFSVTFFLFYPCSVSAYRLWLFLNNLVIMPDSITLQDPEAALKSSASVLDWHTLSCESFCMLVFFPSFSFISHSFWSRF